MMLPNYLVTLPHFLAFLGMGLLLLGVFASLYTFVTPQNELALVRQGNVAAALMLIGALLGFALPVAAAAGQSFTLMRMTQWGMAAGLAQLLVYALMRLTWRGITADIESNNVAVGLLAGMVSVCTGVINAGVLSG
jgi:putative membrane protein